MRRRYCLEVAPGQEVTAFQPLCEVESAKAAVELTAPVAGRVLETRFSVGDTAQKGDVLVLIDTAETGNGEWFGIVGSAPKASGSCAETAAATEYRAPRVGRAVRAQVGARTRRQARGHRRLGTARTRSHRRHRRPCGSPRSQRRRSPLQGMRKAIADHMVEAWRNAPQVTSMDLLDVTELVRARDVLLPAAQAEGTRLTYLPFFRESGR